MSRTYATLDPAAHSPSYTLSAGNLTGTKTADPWSVARSTIGKTSGKWYWEIFPVFSGAVWASMQGVVNDSFALVNDTYPNGNANGSAYQSDGATNGTHTGTPATYTTGDIIGIALDMDAHTLKFYKNGVLQATMASVPSGTIYAAISAYYTGSYAECNFGETEFFYAPPAGYNAGLYDETAAAVPSLTTEAAADLGESSGTLNGTIVDVGGTDVDERGFVYDIGTWGDPGDSSPALSAYSGVVNETGIFIAETYGLPVAGLDPETVYYARAYAHNSDGYAYGNEITFTTLATPPWRFENLNGLDFDHDDKKTIFAERLNEILDRLAALDGQEPDPLL